jgi:hypothetical protein
MNTYTQNGICLGKNYKNQDCRYNFQNYSSIIEETEWQNGYVSLSEVNRVLNIILEKEVVQLERDNLNKLIERINRRDPQDEWYFFEVSIYLHDLVFKVSNDRYLPIEDK